MTADNRRCAVCGTTDDVQSYAWDIDLPPLWLCLSCLHDRFTFATEWTRERR